MPRVQICCTMRDCIHIKKLPKGWGAYTWQCGADEIKIEQLLGQMCCVTAEVDEKVYESKERSAK